MPVIGSAAPMIGVLNSHAPAWHTCLKRLAKPNAALPEERGLRDAADLVHLDSEVIACLRELDASEVALGTAGGQLIDGRIVRIRDDRILRWRAAEAQLTRSSPKDRQGPILVAWSQWPNVCLRRPNVDVGKVDLVAAGQSQHRHRHRRCARASHRVMPGLRSAQHQVCGTPLSNVPASIQLETLAVESRNGPSHGGRCPLVAGTRVPRSNSILARVTARITPRLRRTPAGPS
jgi:hypothetical protein